MRDLYIGKFNASSLADHPHNEYNNHQFSTNEP